MIEVKMYFVCKVDCCIAQGGLIICEGRLLYKVLVDETLQGKNVFEHQFTHVPFCVQNTGQQYERIKMETAVDGFAPKQWQRQTELKLTLCDQK